MRGTKVCTANAGEPPATFVERAFNEIVEHGVNAATLIFDSKQPLTRAIVPIVSSAIKRAPNLRHLVLAHPSPGVSFFVSSIALSTRIRVDAQQKKSSQNAVAESPPPAAVQTTDAKPAKSKVAANTPSPQANARAGWTRVNVTAEHDFQTELSQAFARVVETTAQAVMLVIASRVRLPVDAAEHIANALEKTPHVTFLAIVHRSAAAGFVASTLALRAPTVATRAFSTVDRVRAPEQAS